MKTKAKLTTKGPKIKGKILKKLEVKEGVSKAGRSWRRQQFVIEQDTDFKDELCCTLFNDSISMLERFKEGQWVVLTLNLKSREWNNKYYNDINVTYIQDFTNESAEEEEMPF
jgi:hypothetical protein